MTRHWINTHLNREERQQLVDWLMERAQQPTGDLILQGLGELFPDLDADDLPSIQACISWRNACWAFELHRKSLKEESEAARFLAEAGDGSTLDEANRVMLQSMIFEQLRAIKEGRMEDVDPEYVDKLARNVAVLARQGRDERELRAKLEKMEHEREALAAEVGEKTKKPGGLTAEDLVEIERKLKLL